MSEANCEPSHFILWLWTAMNVLTSSFLVWCGVSVSSAPYCSEAAAARAAGSPPCTCWGKTRDGRPKSSRPAAETTTRTHSGEGNPGTCKTYCSRQLENCVFVKMASDWYKRLVNARVRANESFFFFQLKTVTFWWPDCQGRITFFAHIICTFVCLFVKINGGL